MRPPPWSSVPPPLRSSAESPSSMARRPAVPHAHARRHEPTPCAYRRAESSTSAERVWDVPRGGGGARRPARECLYCSSSSHAHCGSVGASPCGGILPPPPASSTALVPLTAAGSESYRRPQQSRRARTALQSPRSAHPQHTRALVMTSHTSSMGMREVEGSSSVIVAARATARSISLSSRSSRLSACGLSACGRDPSAGGGGVAAFDGAGCVLPDSVLVVVAAAASSGA